ncbi:hypothetical protein LSAT2_000173, partial [Lamellibrachia satsuma]
QTQTSQQQLGATTESLIVISARKKGEADTMCEWLSQWRRPPPLRRSPVFAVLTKPSRLLVRAIAPDARRNRAGDRPS